MRIYPAIDLYEGEVVRLTRGDYEQKKIYSKNPPAIALDWERQGAEWIHVVDLEGAKSGVLKNRTALSAIRKSVRCKLQFGGGLRTFEDIRQLLDEGIDRVVLGTKALDRDFFEKIIAKFAAKIAVSMDVRDGRVQTQGWLEEGKQTLDEAIANLNHFPLETLIYTDIERDGMLQGPNLSGLAEVLAWAKSRVILSGGISSLADVVACAKIPNKNFEGAIIGRALYDKKFSLKEAIRLVSMNQKS